MDAPGKGLLKISSILFIIFGAICTLISVVGFACAGFITNLATDIAGGAAAAAAALSGLFLVGSILLLASSALELIIGIVGLRKSGDPSQYNFFILWGYIIGALMLVSMILSFSFWSLIGFVLPVLYIVGGYMNKNAGAKTHEA